ncbi:MAG TPA: DUF6709 family protein [Terriglobales bacterium]
MRDTLRHEVLPMWQNFIGQQVRRTNRNLLIANLLIVAALGIMLVISWSYLLSLFGTPQSFSTAKDLSARLPQVSGTIVTLKGEKSFATGLQWTENNRTQYEYIVLETGDAPVIVKISPGDTARNTYTGTVEIVPDEVRQELMKDVRRDQPGAPDPFPPFLINAHDATREGWIGIAAGVPLFLFALWNLNKYRRRAADINQHPAVAALKVAGQPWEVAQQIEGELHAAEEFRKLKVTANWLLWPTFFCLHVRRLQDLVWVHGKVVRHYTYFIPTGKSWAVIVCDAKGALQIDMKKEKEMTAAIEAIAHRVPQIIKGHSAELEKLYQSRRAEFIAEVQQRKKPKAASGAYL